MSTHPYSDMAQNYQENFKKLYKDIFEKKRKYALAYAASGADLVVSRVNSYGTGVSGQSRHYSYCLVSPCSFKQKKYVTVVVANEGTENVGSFKVSFYSMTPKPSEKDYVDEVREMINILKKMGWDQSKISSNDAYELHNSYARCMALQTISKESIAQSSDFTLIKETNIDGLDAGEVEFIQLDESYCMGAPEDACMLFVVVDSADSINEKDETNNVLFVVQRDTTSKCRVVSGTTSTSESSGTSESTSAYCWGEFEPASIQPGQETALLWNVRGIESTFGKVNYICNGDLGSGYITLPGTWIRGLKPLESQVCTLSFVDPDTNKIVSCNAAITVASLDDDSPICSGYFSPGLIGYIKAVTFNWNSRNADKVEYSCNGNLGSGVFSTKSGSMTVYPLQTQSCTLKATNTLTGEIAYCSAYIQVVLEKDPEESRILTCDGEFNPPIINKGEATTLSWNVFTGSFDANEVQMNYECTGDIGGGTLPTVSGEETVYPGSSQTCSITLYHSKSGTRYTCKADIVVK
jgi:hypothetical protein